MKFLLLIVFMFPFLLVANTPADERPAYPRDETNYLDGGDLCPKDDPKKYSHHIVLIDATTPLTTVQLDLIKRLILSEDYLEQMSPWDRLTIMRLYGVAPAKNLPLFSACRPRTGSPKYHKIDKYSIWTESEKDLKDVYEKLFVEGVNKALEEIKNPTLKQEEITTDGSPIMGQLKEISRLPDLGFTASSGYESRKLTIISDFAQNTERLPFYELCPINSKKKCPSWEKFKNDRRYKMWAKMSLPEFGKGAEINAIFLNSNFDKNLKKGVMEFWDAFFADTGAEFSFDGIETEYNSS